jgi:hypothetical protein
MASKNEKVKNLKVFKAKKKNNIIVKSPLQAFQRCKQFVEWTYGSKDIRSQSFGQPSPVNRDESTSVLLTYTSLRIFSTSV